MKPVPETCRKRQSDATIGPACALETVEPGTLVGLLLNNTAEQSLTPYPAALRWMVRAYGD